jgi:hypothetical protein
VSGKEAEEVSNREVAPFFLSSRCLQNGGGEVTKRRAVAWCVSSLVEIVMRGNPTSRCPGFNANAGCCF